MLYVNPFGPGTKNVKTSLICVEPIPADENGYTFIANFMYENPNSSPVYVPLGGDNIITGTGKFENSQQPVLFMPGKGSWQARFNGNKITWALTTYNGTHKSSTASDASSSSNKCTKSASLLTSSNSLETGENAPISVYPNPTSGIVNLVVAHSSQIDQGIIVTDISGRQVMSKIQSHPNGNVQVDLSDLEKGIYLIRIKVDGQPKTVKVLRE